MKQRADVTAKAVIIVLALSVALAVAGCSQTPASGPAPAQASSVQAVADQVIAAIKGQDGAALSSFVHPGKGVRFSPYAFVDVKKDVVLKGEDVASLWDSTKVYAWGKADGTGAAIKLTPAQYFARYVFDVDFSTAASVSVNADVTRGTTVNNAADVYPGSTRVEYFLPGAPAGGQPGNDWKALRLVFEKVGDTWYLIAIIHDEWTT